MVSITGTRGVDAPLPLDFEQDTVRLNITIQINA
jgi:hypothetical protein